MGFYDSIMSKFSQEGLRLQNDQYQQQLQNNNNLPSSNYPNPYNHFYPDYYKTNKTKSSFNKTMRNIFDLSLSTR